MTKSQIPAILREVLAEVCQLDPDALDADTLIDDLALDSVALTGVLIALEERLQVDLPFDLLERLEEVRTLGEVWRILEPQLKL